MTALEEILAKYPTDEVDAILPVVWISAAAAPLDQISPQLNQKIAQSMSVMGIKRSSSPEDVAMAIAKYCVEKRINASILLEISTTYQEKHTSQILQAAAAHVDEAAKVTGAQPVKTAPPPRLKKPPAVKAKRGLKKK